MRSLFQVREQMKANGIHLYSFDNIKHREDALRTEDDQPPFAVVAANTLTTLEDGRRVRGREYPWGTLNIEDKVGGVPLVGAFSVIVKSSQTFVCSSICY